MFFFFFFKQKTAYESSACLVGSEMCIRDSLKLTFRDRAALTFMLLAPFLLTIGMGFVTGRFSGGSSGLSDIPVIIVNLDQEQLGNALADAFSSEELADLMEPTASPDPVAARRLIDEDQAAAAIIIPEGFTRSVIPAEGTVFD